MSGSSRQSEKHGAPCDSLPAGSTGTPFDDYGVHGVIRRGRSIPVPDEQAEYWTVIGYLSGQAVCGIGRFATRHEADEFCRGLVMSPRPTSGGNRP